MTSRDPKAIRKGDYCVVGERHSSTAAFGASIAGNHTREWWTYAVGIVSRTGERGTVIREAAVGTRRLREADKLRWWLPVALPQHAQKIVSALLDREFASLEEFRAAFRELSR